MRASKYIWKEGFLPRLPQLRLIFAGRAREHTLIVLRGRSSPRACVRDCGGVTPPIALIRQHG
jgi:hypothetical protein